MTLSMIERDNSSAGLSLQTKCLGIIGAIGALFVLLAPLPVVEAWLKWLRKKTKPAKATETEELIRAVRWAMRFYPGRFDCLQVPLGACMAGALRGRMPTWCIGAKLNPVVQHAWVEAEGRPVAEPEAGSDWPYKAAIRI